MHLVFDIFTGVGIAAAAGIRPFLPALAVGALGAGNVNIDFTHCSFSFLEQAPFLLAMAVLAALLAFAERRIPEERLERGPAGLLIAGAATAVGALLFAGSLCRGGYAIWPGIVGGIICAAIGILATRPLLARVRARLDAETVGAVGLFTEAGALIAAVLSVLAPPVGVIVLALLLWLVIAGSGRGDQKYAGLRILR